METCHGRARAPQRIRWQKAAGQQRVQDLGTGVSIHSAPEVSETVRINSLT